MFSPTINMKPKKKESKVHHMGIEDQKPLKYFCYIFYPDLRSN